MSNSVAVCEAALPADLPNKRQVCRTVAAIDGNVGAVAGMLDQLHARMSALLRVNQDMQARMQRLERGADPATRDEIQAVRQRYATAISGMAQVLQGLRARVKGLAGASLGVQAPAPPATSSAAPAAPPPAVPASSAASSAPPAASSSAPAATAPAAPDDSTRLTLADVVDAYIYHVLTLGGRFSNEQEQVTRRIGAKVRAATDPQERAALEQLYYDALLDTADLARRREIITGLMQGFADRLLSVASGIKFDAFSTEGKPAEQFTEDLNVLLMTHLAAHGSFVDVVPSLVRLRQELTAYRSSQGQYPLLPALQNIALLHEQPLVATHLADTIANATPEQLDDMLRRLAAATSAVATASRRPSVPVGGLRGSLGSLFTRRQ